MVTSGTTSSIGASQKRLTVVLSVPAILGSLVLGLLWWDSTKNFTAYSSNKHSIEVFPSSLICVSEPYPGLNGYMRSPWGRYGLIDHPLFPLPDASSSFTTIPIYLLILTYLATLLLIWLVLMNRLARRHFEKTRALPTQD